MIFDDNKKTTTTGTSGEEGTGFGMFIVKTYCDIMNYSLSIESKTKDKFPDDHGTSITIHIPRPKTEEEFPY